MPSNKVVLQLEVTIKNWNSTNKRGDKTLLSYHADSDESFDNYAYRVLNPDAVSGWVAKIARSGKPYFELNDTNAIDAEIKAKQAELEGLMQRRTTATPMASIPVPPAIPANIPPAPPSVADNGPTPFEQLVSSRNLTPEWLEWLSNTVKAISDEKTQNEAINKGLKGANYKGLNASELKVVRAQFSA